MLHAPLPPLQKRSKDEREKKKKEIEEPRLRKQVANPATAASIKCQDKTSGEVPRRFSTTFDLNKKECPVVSRRGGRRIQPRKPPNDAPPLQSAPWGGYLAL